MRALVALLLLAFSGPAYAADPCAKFNDADAYNNCLAGFGPAAGPHRLTRAPEAQGQAAQGQAAPARRAFSHGRRAAAGGLPPGFLRKETKKGRVRVEFRLR